MTLDLNSIDAVVLDMDGVVWRGPEILPGVPDFFLFLRDQKIPFALASNNSSKSAAEYVTRVHGLGIPVEIEHVVTSALVTVDELQRTYPNGTPIYVIGSSSLIELLTASGYIINPEHAQVVIVGLDVTLTYDKLKIAGKRLLAGADFIGTNGDLTLPTADGISPGNGSILAALQAMSGRIPRLMGKPEPAMFHSALKRLNSAADRTLMIGDRLDTDILGAQQVGLRTALVLTGISRADEVGPIVPDGIYDSLATLCEAWQKIVASRDRSACDSA